MHKQKLLKYCPVEINFKNSNFIRCHSAAMRACFTLTLTLTVPALFLLCAALSSLRSKRLPLQAKKPLYGDHS